MKTQTLPTEIQEMSKGVSVEKRNEVQNVLNKVFDGVSNMREQLESIEVKDEKDKVNMKLANTIRLGVRQVRLDADKVFSAKRSEVQQQMLSFKTEDSLWLKAKQVKDILTKEIEENAKWKEETAKRFEQEQIELKIKQRENLVNKLNPEIDRSEFENMGDDTFASFIKGIEKDYNDRIEAEKKAEAERIEKERLDKKEHDRRFEIAPFAQFNEGNKDLREMEDSEYNKLLKSLKDAKKEYEIQQEEQRKENERLKKEREAENKRREEEEEQRKALEEERLKKEKAEAKRIADEQAKKQAEHDAQLKKERQAREKLEREAKEKVEAELKSKKEAELAPDKNKLESLAKDISEISLPELKSDEAKEVLRKAQILLDKTSNYIKEQSVKL